MLLQNSVVILLAYGATFVIILGHINVAYGAELAFIGCFSCLVMKATNHVLAAVLAAVVLGLLIGAANGFIITKFTIPAFIMTLGLQTIARGGALLMTGGSPVSMVDYPAFNWFGQGYIGFVPTSVLIMFVFFIIVLILLNKTPFGRYVYAVGGNENAAIASGIRSKSVVRKAFLLDGLITAVAAVVFMARQASGTPAGGISYEFDAITAVVVGGTSLAGGVGNVFGTLIGALIVGIVNNVQNLLGVNTYWQQVIKGFIILFAVIIDVVTKRSSAGAKR
ncbi:MAG: ABC transporter permease [Intestinibacillus sp.]